MMNLNQTLIRQKAGRLLQGHPLLEDGGGLDVLTS